jgi:hypothetical protein
MNTTRMLKPSLTLKERLLEKIIIKYIFFYFFYHDHQIIIKKRKNISKVNKMRKLKRKEIGYAYYKKLKANLDIKIHDKLYY